MEVEGAYPSTGPLDETKGFGEQKDESCKSIAVNVLGNMVE